MTRDICAEVNPDKTEACPKYRGHRSPHSWESKPMTVPKMTKTEAFAEAQRRYGKDACLMGPFRPHTETGHTHFVASSPFAPDKLGSGDSWEEAFRQADARANESR